MRTARTRAQETESETMSEDTGTVATATRTRSARTSRRGFSGYNKTVDTLNKVTFQVKDNSEVIAFLEDENFFYELRHWVKFIGDDGKPATRAEWCLGEDEDTGDSLCPLCDIGDTPKPVAFFNVVDLANPGKVLVWEASADPTKAIQKEFNKLAKRGKHLNDNGVYWVVSREQGRNGYWTYSIDMLLEEDLALEWKSLKPLTEAQRASLLHRAYTETYVEYKDRKEIQDFVDTLG
jgi:hypothetical protein